MQNRVKELEEDLQIKSEQNRILSAEVDEIQRSFEDKYEK